MGKTKIDWCDFVWNSVWGCKHDCEYCYARKMAKRFADVIAKKEAHDQLDFDILSEDLYNFKPTWLESNFVKPFPKKPSRIFVDSMSDIAFWKPEWFKRVLTKISLNPQHTFIFLTKAPKIYEKYYFPSNCWLGVTITEQKDYWRAQELRINRDNKVFISVEPMLDDFAYGGYGLFDWIILGLETSRKNIFVPKVGTIESIVEICKNSSTPLFMKESMTKVWGKELIQEFPR